MSISDCNGTRTHNHLIRKRTLNHLAKLVRTYSQMSIRFFRIFIMDSVILPLVLPPSDNLILLKEVGVSVILLLFVLKCFTPHLSGVFKLTTSLESRVAERMSTISVSQKLNMSIKGSTVSRNVFPFLSLLLQLEYNKQEAGALLLRQCFF